MTYKFEELLLNTKAHIYCMIRCVSNSDATERLHQKLNQCEISLTEEHKNRITVIKADLAVANLSLSSVEYDSLAGNYTTIDVTHYE
jgi:thioester reductase-like protein